MSFSCNCSVFSCVCSVFRLFEKFSKNRSHRCDDFGPKIVKIEAILAIFCSFKDFRAFYFRRWCPGGGVSGSGEHGLAQKARERFEKPKKFPAKAVGLVQQKILKLAYYHFAY